MDSTASTKLSRSHNGRHRSRNRSGPDPLLEVSDDAVRQTLQGSPNDEDSNISNSSVTIGGENNPSHADSMLTDLVLTPIYMISFLLSVLVVDRQQRQWRLSQHAPEAGTSLWSRWWSPEPYQHTAGSAWRPQYSWRRRGIAKLQMNDVFAVRGRVVVAMALWTALGLLMTAYAIRQMYFWATGAEQSVDV